MQSLKEQDMIYKPISQYAYILEIVLEPFLVLFRPGTMSVRSGCETFFVPEAEHVVTC